MINALKPCLCVACVIGFGLIIPNGAWALGTESFGNKTLSPRNYDSWPGLADVVNWPDRVYQNWVNGNENCYYRGDTAALNAAVLKFSKAKLDAHQVVLLPGPGKATTFGRDKVACNWRLHIVGGLAAHSIKSKKGEKDEMGVLVLNPTIYIFVDKEFEVQELKIPCDVKLLGDEELVNRCRSATAKKAD